MRYPQELFESGFAAAARAEQSCEKSSLLHFALIMDCIKDMVAKVDPCVSTVLVVVGGLFVARCALSLLGSLFMTFLRPGKKLTKFGSWAVVTGATGKPFSSAQ